MSGILRSVSEAEKLIVIREQSFADVVLHFRGKRGDTELKDSVYWNAATNDVILDTLAYIVEHFRELEISDNSRVYEKIT